MDLAAFAPRLRQAMAGQSKASLARELGVSETAVIRWANGERNPSGPHLIALSERYRKDPRWFYQPLDTNGN